MKNAFDRFQRLGLIQFLTNCNKTYIDLKGNGLSFLSCMLILNLKCYVAIRKEKAHTLADVNTANRRLRP